MKLFYVVLPVCWCLVFPISNGLALQSDAQNQQVMNNWHQWRGPLATGEAPGGNPPTEWSETKNVRWKVSIDGEGSSTPIIWEDRVFVISAVETDRKPESSPAVDASSRTIPPENILEFVVHCLDRRTGESKWRKVVNQAAPHEGRHKSTTYAAASPTTDGKHVFASFGSYGIYCLTMDGDIVWGKDVGDMRTRRGWGEGVSPTLSENEVVLMWDQEDQSKVFVLDKSNGEILWQKDRDEPTTWATPIVTGEGNDRQIITAGTNHVRSYELTTGQVLWESDGLTVNAIPCPVQYENNVILMSGYRGNVAMSIDLGKLDGTTKTAKPDWKLDQDTPYVPSPLLTNGRLYFTKGLAAVMTVVDAKTGETVIPKLRLPGLNNLYASPVASKEHVFISSREGETLVIENGPKFNVVANNKLDGEIDASPAIVGEQIFVRTKTHLYCLQTPVSIQRSATNPVQEPVQEKSVKPGINVNYLDPSLDVDDYIKRFEVESREVFASRLEILRECGIQPGDKIADIGAGTGLFTRLFSRSVGPKGWVYAVDIAPRFLEHIRKQTDRLGMLNVSPILCGEKSASLPAKSVDKIFICDVYHHFEYPKSTMKSIHQALKDDGTLIVIDFERIPGESRPFIIGHVRAGKEVFRKEIESAGFVLEEEADVVGFKENYFLKFKKSK